VDTAEPALDRPTEGAPPPRTGPVWLLAALMAAAAGALTWPVLVAGPEAAVPGVAWLALLPVFFVAEVAVIHLPAQRSSHSHTLREIPAVVGLTFLAPQQYLTAYVVGGALALLLWTRLRGVKLGFNVAMYALEAALGSSVYHLVLAGTDPIAPRAWVAALVAVLVTDLLSAAAVTAAISLSEGGFDDEVLREALRSGVPAAAVNTCLALLTVTLIVARPSSLPLLGFAAVLLVVGYRFYISLARGYSRMELLYQFVGSTGRTAELDDVVATVLTEAARLMHALHTELVLLGDGSPRSWVHEGAGVREQRLLPTDERSDWWAAALAGEPVLRTAAADGSATDLGLPRDGMAVPIWQDGRVTGVLVVAGPGFEKGSFGPEDLRVVQTLAAHASAAVGKAGVVHRLRQLVTEREREARSDALTGLPNRLAFRELLDRMLAEGTGGAVLMLDLDDFRAVNETLGHTAGDRLLSVTAARLVEAAPGAVARLGGDEFAVLLLETDLETARDRAAALREAVSHPIPLMGAELVVTTSVGVADLRSGVGTGEEVVGHADVALYAAKDHRTGVEIYRDEDGHSSARRLSLAADLPRAIKEARLDLWYQPQATTRTGAITGFEALLRWNHPSFGMVPPLEVVAVAQRTGLMPSLTAYLLDQALLTRREWSLAGRDLDVAVNITPADLAAPDLAARVDDSLARSGTPPGALVIELTESDAMRDPDHAARVLGALAARGVRISVDDFGTGYSSLAYLDRLPVHELKIDQTFVFRLEKAEDATIVRATVTLAHDLGLRVVAEGVESELSRTLVTELGCDLFQGYGLARPMPGDQVLGWLERRDRFAAASHDPWSFAG